MKFKVVDEQPKKQDKKKAPRSQPKVDKEALKTELRNLIGCLGFGHGRYEKFKEYGIRNTTELHTRINDIIDKL